MWVLDGGSDLAVGDYLISSDVKGHAMKDDGTYQTAYIIARVAEPVEWAAETQTINGVKHKKISIFFESFEKDNFTIDLTETNQGIDNLRSRADRIQISLDRLEANDNTAELTNNSAKR